MLVLIAIAGTGCQGGPAAGPSTATLSAVAIGHRMQALITQTQALFPGDRWRPMYSPFHASCALPSGGAGKGTQLVIGRSGTPPQHNDADASRVRQLWASEGMQVATSRSTLPWPVTSVTGTGQGYQVSGWHHAVFDIKFHAAAGHGTSIEAESVCYCRG